MKRDDLGIYLHIPFCKHECPYCDFNKIAISKVDHGLRRNFPELIRQEIELFLRLNPNYEGHNVSTIYFGGGTPSLLRPDDLSLILTGLFTHFSVEAKAEITLEANPENIIADRPATWKQIGFNRLSVGVQSFADDDLRRLERLHKRETIERAFERIHADGFHHVSLDLMFALPGQTLEAWETNLASALQLPIQHISLYGLTYHEGTPFEMARQGGTLSEADEALQEKMFFAAHDRLAAAGFEHYEISNFARPGYRSKHNQRYWHRCDVLAFGPGAHGNLGSRRWMNEPDLGRWSQLLRAELSPQRDLSETAADVATAEELHTRLRLSEGLSATADPLLFKACRDWATAQPEEASRLYRIDETSFRLTAAGWLVSDAILDQISSLLIAKESH